MRDARRARSPRYETNRAYYWANREEILAKSKAWRERNPERLKAYRRQHRLAYPDRIAETRLRKVGLTLERYDGMAAAQGGVCAICRRPETRLSTTGAVRRFMSVDHDHATGVIRGLLCSQCNAGIGHFLDDPALLIAAAAYLSGQPTVEAAA